MGGELDWRHQSVQLAESPVVTLDTQPSEESAACPAAEVSSRDCMAGSPEQPAAALPPALSRSSNQGRQLTDSRAEHPQCMMYGMGA